jgi:hypothetical protein
VEDRVTLQLLASWGCDLAQGFFLARPLTAGELPPWLAGWEERRIESGGGEAHLCERGSPSINRASA